jgi:ubiquinone/menaquinone biosynthesis C-methylase UbiE
MTDFSATEANALARLQSVWESHARQDPLWAILTGPDKVGRRWNLTEFFGTGVQEIDSLFETLALHEIGVESDAALDFGCGVGRLSQALCRRFEHVSGIDISPTMIETAGSLNQYEGKCRYFLNARSDLQLFQDETFSFIYSNIVLQHIAPPLTRQYLAEFSRVLRPEGLLVFHLPSRFTEAEGLPPEAWVASLQCAEQQFSWPASSSVTAKVRIQNSSPVVWEYDPRTPILLGNHWIDDTGQTVRHDDGRALLPNSLRPGASAGIEIEMRTPPSPGRYMVEFDLVQEGVSWFKDKGSATISVPVEVLLPASPGPMPLQNNEVGSSDGAEPATTETKDSFEGFSMWCIPRPEVMRLLYDHDMRIEYVEPSPCGGPGFQSYAYFARKTVALNS